MGRAGGGRRPGSLSLSPSSPCLSLSRSFQTWLRVRLGLHTPAQVVVGAALGTASALAWASLGRAWALPAVAAHPAVEAGLTGATLVAGAVFAVTNLRPTWLRRPQRRG